ncbi:MAG: hypothetical protein ACOY90_04695 [Candidatus Zhuqueibacterota bacterium]
MSAYCKAYQLSALRQFPGWMEQRTSGEPVAQDGSGKNSISDQLRETDYLFLHDSYVVTNGIFEDKNIVFDRVTPEWKKFCQIELQFNIPGDDADRPGDNHRVKI